MDAFRTAYVYVRGIFAGTLCKPARRAGKRIEGLKHSLELIIPGLFEPSVRTLRATIPENGSRAFR